MDGSKNCVNNFLKERQMEKIVIAVAAGVAAIFAVTSIADLRGSNKNRFSGEKAEQIEQEMRDKQAGHSLSDTDQEKVLERLA